LGEVRIDKVRELHGGKMRAHICQSTKGGRFGAGLQGWASMKLLECRSGHCGHCHGCSHGTIPSENRGKRFCLTDQISQLRHERDDAEVRFQQSEKRITMAASDAQKHLHAMLSKTRLKLKVTEKIKKDTEGKLVALLEELDAAKVAAEEKIAGLESQLDSHKDDDALRVRIETLELSLEEATKPVKKSLKEELEEKLPRLRVQELSKRCAELEQRCEEAEWEARGANENEMKMRVKVVEMEVRLKGLFKAFKEKEKEDKKLRDQATALSKNHPAYAVEKPDMAMSIAMVDIKNGLTRSPTERPQQTNHRRGGGAQTRRSPSQEVIADTVNYEAGQMLTPKASGLGFVVPAVRRGQAEKKPRRGVAVSSSNARE